MKNDKLLFDIHTLMHITEIWHKCLDKYLRF